MKLGRKIAIGVVTALALSSTTAGVSQAATSVTGSGSTFIKNLFDACAPTFNDTLEDTTVSYSGGGSGAGRTAFSDGTTNFAGTDSKYGSTAPFPPADYVYVPIIAGPVAIMYKNSDVSGALKLSSTTLAKIFAGTITNWDDAAIKTDNGFAAVLPTKTIKVVYRSDSSGTSEGFTKYLAAQEPTIWTKAGSSTFTSATPTFGSTSVPANFTSKSGSDGVTNGVAATDGSISYVELSYQLEAQADGVKAAYIKNVSGSYIKPTSVSSAAAASAIPAANFDQATGWINPDFTTTVATAYPITIFSFGIAHKTYSPANDVVKGFLTYAMQPCASAQAASLGYAQLTSTALTFAKKQVALVSSVNRPAAATTTVAPTVAPKVVLKASVKVGKTIAAKTVALGGKLTVAKTAKVTLRVTSGATVCKVVGATLKGSKKGTCKVLASVKTGTKTKTATVTVTVS